MTDEQYLRACGWTVDCYGWKRRAGANYLEQLCTSEALAKQLDEDRARYNFVRERSTMDGGLLHPAMHSTDPDLPQQVMALARKIAEAAMRSHAQKPSPADVATLLRMKVAAIVHGDLHEHFLDVAAEALLGALLTRPQ